jgi:hypothetical protein
MLKYLISKWPFALLGTILLGAIGSGVWDLVFKPSFSWLAEALLNIATLGLTTIRDQMYAGIAKGTYERAAVYIFAMLTGAVAAVFTALITALFFATRLPTIPSDSAILSRAQWQKITLALTLFSGLAIGFQLITCARVVYVVRAANNIEQLQRVVAPFIDEEQRLLFASRAAQISSREEYEKIVDDLSFVAKKNNARVPTFDIY